VMMLMMLWMIVSPPPLTTRWVTVLLCCCKNDSTTRSFYLSLLMPCVAPGWRPAVASVQMMASSLHLHLHHYAPPPPPSAWIAVWLKASSFDLDPFSKHSTRRSEFTDRRDLQAGAGEGDAHVGTRPHAQLQIISCHVLELDSHFEDVAICLDSFFRDLLLFLTRCSRFKVAVRAKTDRRRRRRLFFRRG